MATHLQIYAAFSLPILFSLGFSVNMMVWTRCRINYKFIFELDPSNNLDYHQFAEVSVGKLKLSSSGIHTYYLIAPRFIFADVVNGYVYRLFSIIGASYFLTILPNDFLCCCFMHLPLPIQHLLSFST